MSMQALDKRLQETEVKQRKDFLIRNMKRLGVTHTTDGRKLEDVSLYTLEWTYVTVLNEH